MKARVFQWLLACVCVTLFAGTAHANSRAPASAESGFAWAVIDPEHLEGMTLQREHLKIVVPQFVQGMWYKPDARIVAEYTFHSDRDRTLPLVFFATSIRDPAVIVNGKAVRVPDAIPMNEAQQAELDNIRAKRIATDRFNYSNQDLAGSITPFEVQLTTGANTLRFEYTQTMFFRENGTGMKIDKVAFRLDYLLYPAFSWTLAPDFKLDLELVLPDMYHEGWFWDTYYALAPTSSAPITGVYDAKTRTETFTGSYKRFPGELLTIDFKRGKKR